VLIYLADECKYIVFKPVSLKAPGH